MKFTILKNRKELKQHLKDPLYRNSYYLMANSIIGSGLGFFFWMVVARFYDASDAGLAVALISSAGIVTSISIFGLDVSIIRFLNKQKDKRTFINTCLTVVGIATFLIAIVYLLGMDIWAQKLNFVKDSALYIFAFIVFTIISASLVILSNAFIALRDAKYALFQNTIFAGLKVPLPILLAPIFATFGIFGSWGISMSIAFFISIFFFLRKIIPFYFPYPIVKKETVKKTINEIYSFSGGNYIVNLFGVAPALILPLMILHFLTPEDNAYYYIAFAIASLLFVIPRAFSMSLFAEGSFKEETFLKDLKRAIKHAYLLLVPAIIFIIIFGKWLLLLFGKDYSTEGHFLLSILAISGIFIALNSFYITYLRIRLKIAELIIITILTALGILGVSYLLIQQPTLGITGVGFSYLFVQGIVSGYVGMNFWRRQMDKSE